MKKKITVTTILEKKNKGVKITSLTAYDFFLQPLYLIKQV